MKESTPDYLAAFFWILIHDITLKLGGFCAMAIRPHLIVRESIDTFV